MARKPVNYKTALHYIYNGLHFVAPDFDIQAAAFKRVCDLAEAKEPYSAMIIEVCELIINGVRDSNWERLAKEVSYDTH